MLLIFVVAVVVAFGLIVVVANDVIVCKLVRRITKNRSVSLEVVVLEGNWEKVN